MIGIEMVVVIKCGNYGRRNNTEVKVLLNFISNG